MAAVLAGRVVSERRYGHGYGMTPAGWAPGYCWCGRWAYYVPGRSDGCLELALIFGRMPTSHAEARDLGRAHGMEWDPIDERVWPYQPSG